MRPKHIWKQYAKSWLFIDLTLVAAQVLENTLEFAVSGGIARVTRIFRSICAVRLLRVAKMQQLMFILEDYVHSDTLMLCMTLLKTPFLLAIVLHVSTCAW